MLLDHPKTTPLAFVLGVTVLGMLYSPIYVYQPDGDIAPLDSRFMDVLQPLAFSIGGALTGLAAGGALKKSQDDDDKGS